jgi:hypothetical protein
VFVPGLLCLSFLLLIPDNIFQVVVIQPSLSEVVTTFTLLFVLVVRPCTRGYGERRDPKETWGDNLTVETYLTYEEQGEQQRKNGRVPVHSLGRNAGVQVKTRC